MKWFSKILTAIAAVNMILAPVAQAAANWTEKEKAQLAQYRDFLEPMGYTLYVDKESKKAQVFDKTTKKLAMEIPFGEEKQLRKFSPKSINKMMLDEMVRIKNASKASLSHTVRNLPTESAMFFVAMGAVVAGQLITNYSQNPVAMQQHIQHQLSPMGVFGFFTFMYSQGLTSNLLSTYIKNPKFHHMIPYLGMTVGAFLQTYLSSIASDPNVKACAKVMMGGKVSQKDTAAGVEEDPCGKAYEYLVIHKKIWEYAPGIASMLISSGAAALGQALLTKVVLRVTGVDIAVWLTPGTMQVKGLRLLIVKGLQISAFVALDMWFNRHVTFAWKNLFDGADFHDMNRDMVNHVNTLKTAKWNGSTDNLKHEMKHFHQKMMDWRMINMAEVYEAHHNWSEALKSLTSMFNSSYSFYNDFVNEVRNARFNESQVQPLLRTAPLNGVTPLDMAEGREDLYLTHPQFIEGMQLDTVAEAAIKAEALMKSDKTKYLYPAEKKAINGIIAKLSTGDRDQIGKGLLELNTNMRIAAQNVSSSQNYFHVMNEIRSYMGSPDPSLEVGRGFGQAYEKAPSTAEALAGTSYYRQVGLFKTPKITDFLVMQMICGPDVEAGGKVVKTPKIAGAHTGFPSVFLPPTLANQNDEFDPCFGIKADAPVERIYNWPVRAASGKKYKGFVEYLVYEARDNAVGTKEESAFPAWWTAKTESQMQKAFGEFSKSYDEIVVKMVRKMYNNERSSFNRGPMANGIINAVFQEERVYLALLQEMLQPSAKFDLKFESLLKTAPTHAALKAVESEFFVLNNLLKKIEVKTIEGREVIQSPLENYQLEEQVTKIQTALAGVSTLLGVGDATEGAVVTLNKQQRDIAVQALEQLQSLAQEVMMYGSMANAVSWDKIRNIKRLNAEQGQFQNEIQAKLSQMRGMAMPGKN